MSDLNIRIEELISQNADNFQIAKVIKSDIKQYFTSLDELFETTQGKDFFIKHTKTIDIFIKTIYKYLLRKHFGSYIPMSNSIPITLIALGSYGREQLCVYSDIDIMVLYEDIAGYNLKPIMEEFMILAWDSGLKLGSRVHNINEIEEEVKTDITIKTAILESRFIYGSRHLWVSYQNHLQNIRLYNQKEFILEKIEEHKNRLLKYPLDMQANIKDGYGGMRESNMIFWIATVIYGIQNNKDLIDQEFTELEYKEYRSALEYIFKIRNGLHLLAKKKQDTLIFDLMPDLATKLGFKDSPNLTKERQVVSKLTSSLHIVHRFSAVVIKRIIRPYLFDKKNITILKQNRVKKDLYICDNIVYTSFNRKTVTLNHILQELDKLPTSINGFDNSYVYFISQTKHKKLNNAETKLLLKLLQKANIYPILKLFYNGKLFSTIIPYMKKVIDQPQFDGYHKHPVDIHILNTIKCLSNINDPFVNDIYNSLTTRGKTILNLAALFHDIGKGRSQDHHILGENIFRRFAKYINLDKQTTQITAKLIRYHNMMNKVATREDIYSQHIILHFTGLLETPQTLRLLYVLTYADINAVGSNIYKSNTASLLKELYIQCLPAFKNKELVKVSSRRFAKENAIKKLKRFNNMPIDLQKNILSIESNQLFLKYKALSILNISTIAYNTNTMDYKLKITPDDFTISIIRTIPLNLGFLLGKLGFLDVKSTGIYKLFDGKKFFEIQFAQTINEEDLPYIKEIIENSFDMSKTIDIKKPNIKKDEIIIDCNHTDVLAEMKLTTLDQKGLFSYIASIFDRLNIEIHSAKIHSTRTKANDLFLIEKNGNFCPNKDEIVKLLIS